MKLLLILLLLSTPNLANAETRDSDPLLTETLKKEAQGISAIVYITLAGGVSCSPREVRTHIEYAFKLGYIISNPRLVSIYKGFILAARHLKRQDLKREYTVLLNEHLVKAYEELHISKTGVYLEKIGCSSENARARGSAMEYGFISGVLQMFNYHEDCVRAYTTWRHVSETTANEKCSQPFTIHE